MTPVMMNAFSEELCFIFEKNALAVRPPVPSLIPTAASTAKSLTPNISKAATTVGRAPSIVNKPKEGLWTRMGKSLGLIPERYGGGKAGFAVSSKPTQIGKPAPVQRRGQWQGQGQIQGVEGWGEGPRKVTGFGGQSLSL